jgi:hypothetical protein
VRPQADLDLVLELMGEGLTASEISRRSGIPRSTVKDWRQGRVAHRRNGCSEHDLVALDLRAYAYLLGMYLGDGCISQYPRGVLKLRITLDSIYPGIVAECARAIEAVSGGKASVQRKRGERAVEVSNYWKHWACLIPQHGPGRKHARPIVLAEWQEPIVMAHVEPFLRGLIHSDGTRIIATERKGRYVRRAPRYAFSNRSEDILGIFRAACEVAGVHCTRASRKQIAIYSKAAVARLDEFVGPKR